MSHRHPQGQCKLTGTTGRFVRSHLIPEALTRLSKAGQKYVETGIGVRFTRPSSSWYDYELVTREGEDILEAIDTRGIELLRQQKLVWSAWPDGETPKFDDIFIQDGQKLRAIVPLDVSALRLFFLSLLWRAAASSRPQFAEIVLPSQVLIDLRERVRQRSPGPPADYPIQLFQMISRGPEHNRSPLLETKPMPAVGELVAFDVRYVRFYFDGLVAHVHLPSQSLPEHYLLSCLGISAASIIFVHEFRDSRQASNLAEMVVHQIAAL